MTSVKGEGVLKSSSSVAGNVDEEETQQQQLEKELCLVCFEMETPRQPHRTTDDAILHAEAQFPALRAAREHVVAAAKAVVAHQAATKREGFMATMASNFSELRDVRRSLLRGIAEGGDRRNSDDRVLFAAAAWLTRDVFCPEEPPVSTRDVAPLLPPEGVSPKAVVSVLLKVREAVRARLEEQDEALKGGADRKRTDTRDDETTTAGSPTADDRTVQEGEDLIDVFRRSADDYCTCYTNTVATILHQQRGNTSTSIPIPSAPPWRVRYLVEVMSSSTKGSVEFEGGVITDKDGNIIWHTGCGYCGVGIQRGAAGSGSTRVSRLDHNTVACLPCYRALRGAAIASAEKAARPHDDDQEGVGVEDDNGVLASFVATTGQTALDVVETDDQVSLRVGVLRGSSHHVGRMLDQALTLFGGRPALGSLATPANSTPHIEWVTYRNLHHHSTILGEYLYRWFTDTTAALDGGGDHRLPLLGITSHNRSEYMVADIAAAFAGVISVGLHTTYLDDELAELISHAGIRAVVADAPRAHRLVKLMARQLVPTLELVIVMDDTMEEEDDDEGRGVATSAKIVFLRRDILLVAPAMGQQQQQQLPPVDPALGSMRHRTDPSAVMHPTCAQWRYLQHHTECSTLSSSPPSEVDDATSTLSRDDKPPPRNLFSIIYTSGTAGSPKGVLHTEESFRYDVSHALNVAPLVTLSYIPLSHSTDRMRIYETLLNGGRCCFAPYAHCNWEDHEVNVGRDRFQALKEAGLRSDADNGVGEILATVQLVRPTVFIAPSRVWKGLEHMFEAAFNHRYPGPTCTRSSMGCSPDDLLPITSMNNEAKENEEEEMGRQKKELFLKVFGDRLQHVATGGGPTDRSTFEFAEKYIGLPLMESYGCTEAGAIASGSAGHKGWMDVVGDCKAILLHPTPSTSTSPSPSSTCTSTTTSYSGEHAPVAVTGTDNGIDSMIEFPEEGELVVRTPTLSEGYYRNPTATAASFPFLPEATTVATSTSTSCSSADPVAGCRWFVTGDLCEVKYRQQPDGSNAITAVRVKDRAKNIVHFPSSLLVVGGFAAPTTSSDTPTSSSSSGRDAVGVEEVEEWYSAIKDVLHVAVLTSGDVFRAASVTTTTSSSSRTDSSARSPPLNSSHTQPADPLCVVAVVVSSMRPTHELLPLLRQATEERGITMTRRSPTEGGTTPSSCLVSAPSLSSAAADAKGDPATSSHGIQYIVDPSHWSPSPTHRLKGLLTVSLKVNRAAVALAFLDHLN